MKKILFITIFIVVFSSCNVLPKKKTLNLVSSPIELGVVGEQSRSLKKSDYHIFGIPKYESKIKVTAIVKNFDKTVYNRYLKSIKQTSIKNSLKYIDSLPQKPEFIELEIIDKVGVVSAINNKNIEIFNYLKTHDNSSLVSKVRIVVPPSGLDKIRQSDAFYLQTLKDKEQYLMMYKNGKLLEKLSLYNAVTFGYELSSFCWEATGRKIKISTILNEGQNCSENTKRNPNDLIEELTKTSFKF